MRHRAGRSGCRSPIPERPNYRSRADRASIRRSCLPKRQAFAKGLARRIMDRHQSDNRHRPATSPQPRSAAHRYDQMAEFRAETLGDGGKASLRAADGESREDMQQGDLAIAVQAVRPLSRHARSNGVLWISTARAMKVARSATGCQSRSRCASLQSNRARKPRDTRSRRDGQVRTVLPVARLMPHLNSSAA